MKKRLLYLGLLATISQLCSTGCLFHPVARWRANHPCGLCGPCGTGVAYPALHPILARRSILGESVGAPVVGPVTSPPCHGCSSSVVSMGASPTTVVPVNSPNGYPAISYPMPITPGPTVVPSYELPSPMPVKPPTSGQ
ncbi:hypothetical protein [Frigoriglobus tundricola]|uniref:Uncharacterized protein n=1 Tax=Frigoriglobus tundricola TaxID=2774151 RepID=A0A6M5YJT4_9BACT|nr:hypothetical protein [Frigoriglobus tundricola]QJW94297.1 hypothetical protein FTUN_1817 [Frigoriglobus tundricola]